MKHVTYKFFFSKTYLPSTSNIFFYIWRSGLLILSIISLNVCKKKNIMAKVSFKEKMFYNVKLYKSSFCNIVDTVYRLPIRTIYLSTLRYWTIKL